MPFTSQSDEPAQPLHHLLLLPAVDMTIGRETGTSLRSPISGKMFENGQVDHLAEQHMTNALFRQLKHGFAHRKVTLAGKKALHRKGGHGFNANLETRVAVQGMGRTAGADYVMLCYLYDFRDRAGGDFGIERPAQIAFELNLIQVETGRLVWQRHYREKQKALNENVFQFKTFWRRKGRWITAMEMATAAMKEMLAGLTQKYR